MVFCYLNELNKEKVDIDENISSVFYKFLFKNQMNKDNVILKYKDNNVYTELTINQFITKYKIDISDWNEENDNRNPIEIKMDILEYHGDNKIIVFI